VLVEATGAAESGYKTKEGEEAFSYWQVEPDTAKSNYDDFLNSLADRRIALEEAISDKTGVGKDWMRTAQTEDIENELKNNQNFAIAMCRLKYWRVPVTLPALDQEDTPQQMANYWKQYYNTELCKGTTEHFIREWKYWETGNN